jgi:hypothetical protein
MIRRHARASLTCLSAAAILGFAAGCARGPDVESGLGLRRVVLYRNGVGYFQREGRIDEPEVTFRVKKDKVGDFLATLAVMEAGGSSVRTASFPVELVDDDAPARRHAPAIAPPMPGSPEPAPPDEEEHDEDDDLATVRLTLDGDEHDLVVGYVAETPVWRPSYRLVLSGKSGTADLQAWGIVQNLSGEDWHGVQLSLIAGAPLAFQATLDKPVIPARPIVTDQGEVIASVPTAETTLAEPDAAPPPPPMPMPAPVDAEEAMAEGDDAYGGEASGALKKNGRASTLARRPAAPPASMAPPMVPPRYRAFDGPSAPRNVSALAAVAIEGGTTRYDLPFPVDVPDQSATMVLLLATHVPGEAVFLFAPDPGVPDSSAHPFRVARFRNATQGLLERGPIAVFEKGAFLGQGLVEPLPPGATATVPFALERGLAVDSTRTETQEGARLAKIEAGQIEIERDWVVHAKYAVKNGSDEPARVLVKHPRLPGTRLHDPPKGTEDNLGTGSALVPLDVPKQGKAVLDVDERRGFRVAVDVTSPLADEAVKAYLADPRADAAVAQPLRAAWELRGRLRGVLDELAKLRAERGQLEAQSGELRANLRAIEKNKTADELRRELTDRLARASARLDEITKRAIVLEMQESELGIRLRDLLAPVRLYEPLAPVKP